MYFVPCDSSLVILPA